MTELWVERTKGRGGGVELEGWNWRGGERRAEVEVEERGEVEVEERGEVEVEGRGGKGRGRKWRGWEWREDEGRGGVELQ